MQFLSLNVEFLFLVDQNESDFLKLERHFIIIIFRIDAPKRREPAQEISEFNLSSKPEDTGNKVSVDGLLNELTEKVTHKEIIKKVKESRNKSKTLPRPLEDIEAKKVV